MDDGCSCCEFFFSSSFSVVLKEISSMLGYFVGWFLCWSAVLTLT